MAPVQEIKRPEQVPMYCKYASWYHQTQLSLRLLLHCIKSIESYSSAQYDFYPTMHQTIRNGVTAIEHVTGLDWTMGSTIWNLCVQALSVIPNRQIAIVWSAYRFNVDSVDIWNQNNISLIFPIPPINTREFVSKHELIAYRRRWKGRCTVVLFRYCRCLPYQLIYF